MKPLMQSDISIVSDENRKPINVSNFMGSNISKPKRLVDEFSRIKQTCGRRYSRRG